MIYNNKLCFIFNRSGTTLETKRSLRASMPLVQLALPAAAQGHMGAHHAAQAQNYMAVQSNQDILSGLFAGANFSGGVFNIHLPSRYWVI